MGDTKDNLEPPRKRVKTGADSDVTRHTNSKVCGPSTLTAPISPPRRTTASSSSNTYKDPIPKGEESLQGHLPKLISKLQALPSPFQLTAIEDLPSSSNVDTISLQQLLGDPLIAECWEFNYLHDIDFLISAFDPDTSHLVKVHVVHGFWKQEDASELKAQAARHANVVLHTAYMPEMFGTHHTKMMILLRHDETAQIIIHTANMIQRDWRNMTQAVWQSPVLPLRPSNDLSPALTPGSGHKFKIDFLNYLKAYDTRRIICKPIISQLEKYDFSEIRGALVSSTPGRRTVEEDPMWGWPALRKILASVPVTSDVSSEIIAQVSSIATLGVTDQWLDKTLFKSLRVNRTLVDDKSVCKMVFPTADEIRRSLDGYSSGASIRLRIESGPQMKQLQYLKPLLHHWAGDGLHHTGNQPLGLQDAGRKRAAPHIKTYIRFSDATKSKIDWVLVTSANLSKQAWGEACNKAGEVRISSYELGVLVWPELFEKDAVMIPVFKKDKPDMSEVERRCQTVVGFRMPYDLPLIKYATSDIPWSATGSYSEPDWMGNTWNAG